jgi:hypothetical protein
VLDLIARRVEFCRAGAVCKEGRQEHKHSEDDQQCDHDAPHHHKLPSVEAADNEPLVAGGQTAGFDSAACLDF